MRLVIFILASCFASLQSFSLRPNQESNEIRDHQYTLFKPLPACRANSVCAYLQANHRGINVQPFCECQGSRTCRHVWDSMDGHSITQGSDQYKFCDRVIEPPRCNLVEFAYTSLIEYSKATGDMVSLATHVHCWCPEFHTYDLFDTQFDENEEFDIMLTKYTCQPLKTCEPSDSCRVVTDSGNNFLVKDLCTCPHRMICPSDSRYLVESTPMEKGTVKLISCQ
uniref:Uncharacterized protein n=1 Tax=Strigamia maritima TaxID=126957 RepID=T1J0Y9_STRMM